MNDKRQSNTENLFSKTKYMLDKCRKFGVKQIVTSGLVFTPKVLLKNPWKTWKTLDRYIFVKTISIYYNQI